VGCVDSGNEFLSYTPAGWRSGPIFADQYYEDEAYVFSIERDDDSYEMSVTGTFVHGGRTTYRARRAFRERPIVWHYNRTREEGPGGVFDQVRTFLGRSLHTWPGEAAYPDYFFFGDPHINYYQGTADFDDLKLYVAD
jgi:hypothetical protein